MKKKRIILASILGAAALFAGASIVTAVVSNNVNRIQENVNDGIEESDLAEDSVFGTGIESIIVNKEVKKKESTDALLTPVIGRQYAYDSTTGKVSIRFIAAVSSLDVDAVWRRTLYNSDGSVNRTGTYKSTKAYTTLAYKYKNDKNEDVTETQTAEEFAGEGYNYFVLYTLKNIPISDCSSIEASIEISNDAYTEVSKTGSVATTSTADISSYEASLTIDGNYSYKASSNTSAGNGQYINGKLKTIYSTNDTSLNTDYISLGLTKTYTNTTESSNYYYNDSDFSQRISFSGFSQTAGAHTIKVQCGATAASYDIYVLATDCAYQDANNNYVVTVDKSYTGIIGAVSGTNGNMFTTISQALEFLQNDTFVPTNANKILNIGAGYYKEKLEITTPNLTIKGSGTLANGTYSSDENYNATDYAKATIIEYDTLFGQDAPGLSDVNYKHTTDSTQTVAVRDTATNCKIDGVTISNAYNCEEYFDANKLSLLAAGLAEEVDAKIRIKEHRALALLVQSDAFQMNNCALLGYQDTLELMTGRQYFNACYISGRTDYIFGTNNITLFNGCTIHTIESNGFVTAFKGINKGSDNPNYATVFKSCTFEGDLGVANTALARPWDAYANVAFIECVMDSTISTEAYIKDDTQNKRYVKMNVEPTVSTVNFVEYGNTGVGAISTAVNGMSMLDADTAKNYYTYSTLFGKTNGNVSFALAWDPVNGYEQDYNTYYIFDKSSVDTGTSYVYSGDTIQNGSAKLGDMTIDASASGAKLAYNGSNSSQFNAGTILSIAVSAGTTVTVNSYPGYHSYNVTGSSDTTVKIATADTSTYYFASAQTVYITSTGTSYLTSVVINSTNQSNDAELDSIALSESSLSYYVGDTLDISNVKVYKNYSTGYKVLLTSSEYDVVTSNVDMSTADTYYVSYTLKEDNTKTVNLSIVVKSNNIESLSISGQKTSYNVNDSIDTDFVVIATYSNSTSEELDSSLYTITNNADMTTPGLYTITVTLNSDNSVFTSFNITVSAGEYTITFMDGENVVSTCTGAAGTAITYPTTTKAGYQFVRYYTDSDFTNVYNETEIGNESLVVYLRYIELNKSGITYVSTADELVTAINNQSTIWLTSNIDMTYSTYLGKSNAWAGNVNGYGYTISNWNPTYTSNQSGFFGNAYQGTIEDVIFKDCTVSDGGASLEYLGLLTAGTYDDEIIKNVKLINCSMNTSKSKTIGLIGTVPQAHGSNPSLAIINLTIDNCSVAGTQYIGGIFGYVQNSTVVSIINSSIDVKCTTSGAKIIGGIAGQIQNTANISVNNSEITLTITNGDTYIGGVVGYGKAGTVSVSNSNISLNVSAAYSIGGVIGDVVAADVIVTLSNNMVTGSITVSNGSANYENTYVGHNGSSFNYSTCKYKNFTLTGATATFQGTEDSD